LIAAVKEYGIAEASTRTVAQKTDTGNGALSPREVKSGETQKCSRSGEQDHQVTTCAARRETNAPNTLTADAVNCQNLWEALMTVTRQLESPDRMPVIGDSKIITIRNSLNIFGYRRFEPI
jgi:hypothetical protein